VNVLHAEGEPQQPSSQWQPSWLSHEYSLEIELHDFAEPRHSFDSDPDQLQPSWLLHEPEP
jgi:hypothetical protein